MEAETTKENPKKTSTTAPARKNSDLAKFRKEMLSKQRKEQTPPPPATSESHNEECVVVVNPKNKTNSLDDGNHKNIIIEKNCQLLKLLLLQKKAAHDNDESVEVGERNRISHWPLLFLGSHEDMLRHAPLQPRVPEAPQRLSRIIEALSQSEEMKLYFEKINNEDDRKNQKDDDDEKIVKKSGPEEEDSTPSSIFETMVKNKYFTITPRFATLEEISRVHDINLYKDFIEKGQPFQHGFLPSDAYCTNDEGSSIAVKRAVGLCIEGASIVYNYVFPPENNTISGGDSAAKKKDCEVGDESLCSAFCLVRPPGHHCTCNKPSGFCLVNNVVIALKHVQHLHHQRTFLMKNQNKLSSSEKEKEEKVEKLKTVIIDFDVHFGDGTYELIKDDESVLFISLHRYDEGKFFPYTGHLESIGNPDIQQCINVPFNTAPVAMEEGGFRTISDFAFEKCTLEIILPQLEIFKPDLIFVSCGFDAGDGDPLGSMGVVNGFGRMILHLQQFCRQSIRHLPKEACTPSKVVNDAEARSSRKPSCGVVCFLEGGYNPQTVANGAIAVMESLISPSSVELDGGVCFPPNTSSSLLQPCVIPPGWQTLRQKTMRKKQDAVKILSQEYGLSPPFVDPPPQQKKEEEETKQNEEENIDQNTKKNNKKMEELLHWATMTIFDDEYLLKKHHQWIDETVSRVVEYHHEKRKRK